jgi:hypothetical protein
LPFNVAELPFFFDVGRGVVSLPAADFVGEGIYFREMRLQLVQHRITSRGSTTFDR